MKKIDNILHAKIVRYFIIPVALFGIWLVCSLLFLSDFPLTVLSYEAYVPDSQIKLIKGNNYIAEFKARENNLGIVILRFNEFLPVAYENENILLFRIRQKGQRKWYYENKYRSGAIYSNFFQYPFGFPVIANSAGKTYQFQLTSQNGTDKNALFVSGLNPNLRTVYTFSKQEIFRDFHSGKNYLGKKISTTINSFSLFLKTTPFLVPFLLYLYYLFSKKITIYGTVFYSFFIIAIITDIFFLRDYFIGVQFVVMGLWLFINKITKNFSITVYICGILFVLDSIFVFLHNRTLADRTAVWAYMSLIVLFVQLYVSVLKDKKK